MFKYTDFGYSYSVQEEASATRRYDITSSEPSKTLYIYAVMLWTVQQSGYLHLIHVAGTKVLARPLSDQSSGGAASLTPGETFSAQ